MKAQDYTTIITLDAAADKAFAAIKAVTKWWTENVKGSTHNLHDEFTVRFGDVHVSKQKLIEVIPNKKIVWLVTESRLNFTSDKHEWTGTQIVFDIIDLGDRQTQIHFSHEGLAPNKECFDACSNAWGQYIQESLLALIKTGTGRPTPRET